MRQAGGSVGVVGPCARIDGWGLNLSRALGDFHYKAREVWEPRRLQWSSGKGRVFRPREKIFVGPFQACATDVYDDYLVVTTIFFETNFFTLATKLKVEVDVVGMMTWWFTKDLAASQQKVSSMPDINILQVCLSDLDDWLDTRRHTVDGSEIRLYIYIYCS